MSISQSTAAIVSGTALVIHGALKRGPLGALAVGGGGLIVYLGMRKGADVVLDGRQILRASHTVDAEPYDAFLHWQDLSQLPSVLPGIGTVKKLDNGNWRIGLPGGVGHVEMQVANQQPGHVIEWRSVEGSKLEGRGIVRFTRKKNGRGTKVHTELVYGKAGESGNIRPARTLQPA